MTVREAAEKIGCNVRYVRTLIQRKKLIAFPVQVDGVGIKYCWDIQSASVRRFLRQPQGRGWPRGKPRNTGAR